MSNVYVIVDVDKSSKSNNRRTIKYHAYSDILQRETFECNPNSNLSWKPQVVSIINYVNFLILPQKKGKNNHTTKARSTQHFTKSKYILW